MSILDYLAWTAQAVRVNLESALIKQTRAPASDQVSPFQSGVGTREHITAFYQARIEQLVQSRDRIALTRARYARYVLSLGFVLAILLLLSLGMRLLPTWTAALTVLPLVPAIISIQKENQCRRQAEETTRLLALYERRLARVKQEWMGKGDPGLDLREPDHLSARDLDLFGDGSMFELLCDVDTPAGRETLAKWLQHPASLTEAISRRDSIRSLRARTDMREGLALLRDGEASEYSWRILREWLVADPSELPRWALPGARLLPVALLLFCASWAAGLLHAPAALWLLAAAAAAEGTLAITLRGRVRSILDLMQLPAQKVESLRRLSAFVLGARLESARLAQVQTELKGSTERISTLFRLVRRLRYRDDPWTIWPFLLSMGSTRAALSIERWRQQHGRKLVEWMTLLGEFEALMAIATYAYENPDDAFPEFADNGPLLEARDMGHPLMDPQTCVRNDIALGREARFLLVTGSNMSGKSTLLRAVGLNATLAQMGAPVRAGWLRLSQMQVCASVRIEDSLLDGASHFYAEAQRIKVILDLAKSGQAVLFLIDELFAGTNSADRRVAAEAVVRSLAKHQTIGLATSHDLALSEIAEAKESGGKNVHFTDVPTADASLAFDYRIHPGKLARSNALKIVKLLGIMPE